MAQRRFRRCAALATALALAPSVSPAPAAPPRRVAAPPVYKDATQPIEARVDDLLARMTLPEKIAQITTVWEEKGRFLDARGEVDPAKLAAGFPDGIGQIARPSDLRGTNAPKVAPGRDIGSTVALIDALQRWATTRTRLGIPILFHEEGLHGYAAPGATSFPQAIAQASSWDPDLVRAIDTQVAREIAARGVKLVLSPVVDIARDPRWGRIEETFGEDPYLVGELGVAAVEGLQGKGHARLLGPDQVFATLKHLTGHGQPESGENVGPAPIAERELRSNFFVPFEQVVARTGIEAVMASYNEIDGVPSHVNRWLLTDVLRGEWGFRGAVVSDYSAIDQLKTVHHLVPDLETAARRALAAGVDADLPDGLSYATLTAQVRDGRVPVAQVDAAARRMLELKFRAGLFEHPYADAAAAARVTNDRAARDLALVGARRSIVLLKNDGMLPLRLDGRPKIAVIGPNAAIARLGGYSGTPPHVVSVLDGLRDRLAGKAELLFAQGVRITTNDDPKADAVTLADPAANRRLIAEAVEVAQHADRIVLCVGDTEQTSREGYETTHLGDRTSLDLVGEQQALFDALRALGKPIAVVLLNGRPPSIVTIAEQANAIVEGWYLGEQGGNAVADVLTGAVNPGGKLPVTFAREVGQLPMFYDAKPSARRGYLFASAKPLFPFGWGLSYARFTLDAPRLSQPAINTGGSVDVAVDVANTSDRAGDETVQVYVRHEAGSVTTPALQLAGFRRVTLGPGERRTVTITLGPRAFELWNLDMHRVVEPGRYTILAGPNSVDLQTASLTIN